MILDDGGDLTAMVHNRFPELLGRYPRHFAKRPPPACIGFIKCMPAAS